MVRDTNPARYMGRVRASELDLEMMVLSRSKKAASIAEMVGQGAVVEVRRCFGTPWLCTLAYSVAARKKFGKIRARGLVCPTASWVLWGLAQKPTLRPAPSHGSSST